MYQFFHLDTYSLSPSKNSKSFSSVARELMRHPDAIPHVEKPLPPKILLGVDAYQAEAEIRRRAEKARDKIGRKIRKDALLVLAGVMSYERTKALQDKHKFKLWVHSNIDYLKAKYKQNLLSVILHLDEEHPHVHFIVAPDDTDADGMCNIMYQFEPTFARQTTTGGRKAKFDAYKKAARSLQDEYYQAVSIRFGMLRTGAGRQRLTRAEHNARKAQAKEIALAYDELKAKSDSYDNLENLYCKIESELNVKKNLLTQREAVLREKEQELTHEKNKTLEYKKQLINEAKAQDKNKFFIMLKDIKSLKELKTHFEKLYTDLKSKFNVLTFEYNKLNAKYANLEKECDLYKNKAQKRYELLKLARSGKVNITTIDIDLNVD
ncbi:plasmid recombination protein [Vibrio vulnificus]|uniref:plasmid recombination protein n=1 Tax=Vibrio vulnificus TaxID=672 RepID=UPI00405831D8